ncbi:DUF5412 domain-containing protein [Microbacterium sp. APC 3898]|uniref:DUF5412 domain-containing protein n=1 Tax=Planococcus notacanthi TaxID=3035188 RepID=A0ABT7ZHC3_9BACL|nr:MULTISPECIES: DUF5412 domain-containing protein [Terrabacteria group]MDN3426519.1 DUF5412 domain-containing protein [Planococcus sp. APC 4016]MDN3500874.1 DUF5412 domain-containing protein [Microbacterium sp. APC 3898]
MVKKVWIVFGSFAVLIALAAYGVHWAFFDIQRVPEGEYLTESVSPDGRYTVRAYKTNGGATVAYSIRGELVFNIEDSKTKNIYWNYKEDIAVINWIDDDTVDINGHLLDVPEEKFDFRNE